MFICCEHLKIELCLDYILSCSSWGMKSPITFPPSLHILLVSFVVCNIWQSGNCLMVPGLQNVLLDGFAFISEGTLWVHYFWSISDLFSDGFLISWQWWEFGLHICSGAKTLVPLLLWLLLCTALGSYVAFLPHPQPPFTQGKPFISLGFMLVVHFQLLSHAWTWGSWFGFSGPIIIWVCSPWI